MQELQDISDIKISKLNEAGNQLNRINILWQQANDFAIQGSLPGWNAVLSRVWSELSGDAQPEQVKDNKKMDEALVKLGIYSAILSLPKSRKLSFTPKLLDLQTTLLKKKDMFLRNLQNTQGKGVAYKNMEEDDFE